LPSSQSHGLWLNLIDVCVPSQSGLFCDAPRQHNVARLRTSYSNPFKPMY